MFALQIFIIIIIKRLMCSNQDMLFSCPVKILDFVSMNVAATKSKTLKGEGGWHRIAWGFLKVRILQFIITLFNFRLQ